MLKKIVYSFIFFLLISCQNFGQLNILADLPNELKEVSGTEVLRNSNIIWMINDGGNKSTLYGVSEKGKIKKEIEIKGANTDWEDLTSDEKGTIYIGNFGNNTNSRKNLRILKIDKKYLRKKKAEVEEIKFEYEDQYDFPPKKKELFFDAEAFFYFKKNFYIFTKSRVEDRYGKTSLYKVMAEEGKHTAKLIGEFENCNDIECWITSADISSDGKKVVLLSQKNVLVFTDFKGDNFLSGKVKKIELKYESQKEGICFKDGNTLLITDEKSHGEGGNLYELKIDVDN
jgi:hypothetical protein